MDIFKKITGNGGEPDTRYTIRCNHCPWYLKANPTVPIVGGFDPATGELIGKMKSHMESKHIPIAGEVGLFSAFLIAANFKLEDPLLLTLRSNLRYTLHRSTRVVQVADEMIRERVAQLVTIEGLTEQQAAAVQALLSDMRDVLTESGQYGPKEAPASPLVTV